MSVRGSLGNTIAARGFRRWYERQLVEAFACMITGALSLLMMGIAIETLELGATAAGLLALVAISVAGGGLCIVSWSRFHRLLSLAEHLGEQATCANCHAYARFSVVASRELADTPAGCTIDVRCRACGQEWTME